MKWQRWHAVAAGAALLAIGVAIGKCDGRSGGPAPAASSEAAVPAPDDLVAELVVSTPNASWTRLQRGVGGAVGILPATLPGVVVGLVDLDATVASELDGTSPMFGVLAGSTADPAAVLAIKLVDPRHARAVLGGRADAAADRKVALDFSPNGYLLLGRRPADLARLGPYVTRTMPARFAEAPPMAAAIVEVPRSALAKAVAPALDAWWKDSRSFLLKEDEQMRAKKGRAPDLADPTAIVATLDAVVGRRLAVTSDLQKIRVSLDVTDDAAVVTATLDPLPGKGPAKEWIDGMRVGDAAPVLALPATSALALETRDSDDEREAQAKELENAVTSALGPRLKDPARLHDVLESATKARAEAVALALSLEEPSGLFLRAPVRDVDAANRAIRGAFELFKTDPLKELVRVRDVVASNEDVAGLGKVDVLTITREPPPKRSKADAKPLGGGAWVTDGKTLSLAVGPEPAVTLKLGAAPDRKLADEPSLKRFLGAVGSDATTVMIAQPLRLDPKRASLPPAPLAVALGRHGGQAFVQVDIADALLRETARWQMGF